MIRGDVVRVDLPWPKKKKGREQAGERPAVIVQTDDDTLPTTMLIPFTTNLGALRFPYTVRVDPTADNGLSDTSVLMVFQMRVVDKRRIGERLGSLEAEYMTQTQEEIEKLLELK